MKFFTKTKILRKCTAMLLIGAMLSAFLPTAAKAASGDSVFDASANENGAVIIAALETLPEDILIQSYPLGSLRLLSEIKLPADLYGHDTVGEPVFITGIKWYCPEFDPYEEGHYIFIPLLPEGFAWTEQSEVQVILVRIYLEDQIAAPHAEIIQPAPVNVDPLIDSITSDHGGAGTLFAAVTEEDGLTVVTVTGTSANAISGWELNIPSGTLVRWKAAVTTSYSGFDLITARGLGKLEIAEGAQITHSGTGAMNARIAAVRLFTDCDINGGTIICGSTESYPYAEPVILDEPFITLDVTGGTFTSTGSGASVIFINTNKQGCFISIRGGKFIAEATGSRAVRWYSNNLQGNFYLYCDGGDFNKIWTAAAQIFAAYDNTDQTAVTYYYNSHSDQTGNTYISDSNFPNTSVSIVDIADSISIRNASPEQFLSSSAAALTTEHAGTHAGPVRLDPPDYLVITGAGFIGGVYNLEVLRDSGGKYYISGSGSYDEVNLDINTLLRGIIPVRIFQFPAISLTKWTLPENYANIVLDRSTATYNGTSQAVSALSNPPPFNAGIPEREALFDSIVYSYLGLFPIDYGPNSVPPVNSGTYRVTVSYFNTHIQGSKEFDFTIGKKTLAGNQPEIGAAPGEILSVDLSGLLPFIAFPETYSDITYTIGPVSDSENILTSVSVDKNELRAAISNTAQAGNSALAAVNITGSNHEITNASVKLTVTDQIPVGISAQISGGVYKAAPYEFTDEPVFLLSDNTQVTLDPSDYTITYLCSADNGRSYLPLVPNTAPKDAGYYAVEIATSGASLYYGINRFSYRITQAELTVFAENKNIDQFDMPLPQPTVSYTGFKGSDDAAGVFSFLPEARHSAAHTQAKGEFPIFIPDTSGLLNSGAGANYTLIRRAGTLTVSAASMPAPTFQFLTLAPRQIYAQAKEKTITLYGSGLNNATGIEFYSVNSGTSARLTEAAFTDIRRFSESNLSLSVDLAKTGVLNDFAVPGAYSVKLLFGSVISAAQNFVMEETANFTPGSYGILRISQAADKTFRAEAFEGETEMARSPSAGKSLITIRGVITAENPGAAYTVKGDAVINRALTYSGGDFTVQASSGNVVIESGGNISNVLKWQGVPILFSGFKIELDSADFYKLNRLDTGRDILIYSKSPLNTINLYSFTAEANAVKLYEKEFSVSGKADLKAAIPTIDLGAAGSAELHDMLLGEKTGLPPMHITAKAGLDAEGQLGKLINGGFNLEFELDTMPETSPNFVRLTGDMDINEVIHLEGELVFTWADGLYLPEKLDLFARVENGGVPLIPPVILAYINGFGGGIDGLSRTVRGQYGMIPPLTINAKGAIKDVSGAILEISKATITLGPSQISLIANEGKLLKVIKLTNVGLSMGFMDPDPQADIPDIYFSAGGEFGFDWKILSASGKINLSAYLRGYYLENAAGDIWNIMKKLNPKKFDARSISSSDLNTLLNNLIMAVDLEGSFRGELKIDIFIAGAKAWGELGFSKKERNIKLSGGVGFEGYILGESIGSISVMVVWDVTDNNISVTRSGRALSEPGYLLETKVNEDITERLYIGNITPAGSLSLGAYSPMLRTVQPQSLIISNPLTHGVSLSSQNNAAEIIVTSPTGGFFDDLDFGELKSGGTVHGTVSNAGTNEDPKKLLELADGTRFLELSDNSYKISPVWRQNEESGLYEAGFLLKGEGVWSFETVNPGDFVSLTLLQITPIPGFDGGLSVSCRGGANYRAEWGYIYDTDGVAAENIIPESELLVKMQLLDENGENVICDLGGGASLQAEFADFTMPSSLNSGKYIIKAMLFHSKENAQPAECFSIITSDAFEFINPEAPGTVTGVKANYAGDGAFEVKWDKIAGADGYSITVLENDNGEYKPVQGIGEVIVRDGEKTLISGGMVETYVIDTETNSKESALCGIGFDKEYITEVRAFSEIISQAQNEPDDPVSVFVHGNPGISAVFSLPKPNPPALEASIPGAREIADGENGEVFGVYMLNAENIAAGNPTAKIISDADNISAFLNGEPIYQASGPFTDISFPLPFAEDGHYTLLITAKSALGDTSEAIIEIIIKTSPPEISLDENSFFGENGEILISGMVEMGTTLQIDGADCPVDSGLFSRSMNSDMLHTQVKLTAEDKAGNVSERILDVLMRDALTLPLTEIELRLENGAGENGGYVIDAGSPPVKIELWGIFGGQKNVSYRLNPADAELEIIYNTGDIDPYPANWTVGSHGGSGSAVFVASYETDSKTKLYGALSVNIGDIPKTDTFYRVIFDLNGGTRTGGGELTQSVISGGAATAPVAIKSGYIFSGWDSAFDNVTADITITAKWMYNGSGGYTPDQTPAPVSTQAESAPAETSAVPDKVVIINGVAVSYTIGSGGIITLKPTEAQIKQIIEASPDGNITADINAITGAAVNGVIFEVNPEWFRIAKFKSLSLILKGAGRVIIKANVFESLSGQNGILQFTLKKGSLIFDIIAASTGMTINYNDPANPLFIIMPLMPAAKTDPEVYTAVKKGLSGSAVIPYSVYRDGELTFQTASTGTFDIIRNEKTFTDTAGHWASQNIAFAAARNLFSGYGNGVFAPQDAMSRAMFAQVLANIENIDPTLYNTSRFTDVGKEAWYAPAVEWAAKAGIINGYGGGLFGPEDEINREQIAVMLARYIEYKGYVLPADISPDFNDDADISSWAYDAVKMIQAAGITDGRPGDIYAPKDKTERAEAAAIISRFIEIYTDYALRLVFAVNTVQKAI